jgi:hypothetical protein
MIVGSPLNPLTSDFSLSERPKTSTTRCRALGTGAELDHFVGLNKLILLIRNFPERESLLALEPFALDISRTGNLTSP